MKKRVLSVSLRKELAGLFPAEIGHAKMWRTEVRPICNRRAISALLMPARCSTLTSSAFVAAVMGGPNLLSFCRAWAKPARTRSRRISRSNSAKTGSNAGAGYSVELAPR